MIQWVRFIQLQSSRIHMCTLYEQESSSNFMCLKVYAWDSWMRKTHGNNEPFEFWRPHCQAEKTFRITPFILFLFFQFHYYNQNRTPHKNRTHTSLKRRFIRKKNGWMCFFLLLNKIWSSLILFNNRTVYVWCTKYDRLSTCINQISFVFIHVVPAVFVLKVL